MFRIQPKGLHLLCVLRGNVCFFVFLSVSIIALLRRCAHAAFTCALLGSFPRVFNRVPLSVRSSRVPPPVPRMPHTNKSRNAPVSCEPGRVQEAASAAEEVVEESLAVQDRGGGGDAGGGGEGEDNVGDSAITKSPSDPKQYR